jgi:hypothetical protein
MLKTLIAPVQQWLLKRAQCVGCGANLNLGKREKLKEDLEKVTCACGRIFIYSLKENLFRRALLEDLA